MIVGSAQMAWQRRSLTVTGETKIEDTSPGGAPIALYLPAAVMPTDHVLMMEMVSAWFREQDMTTALTSVPTLLCVRISRFHQTNGNIAKQIAEVRFWQGMAVPVFCNPEGLQVTWPRMQPLAAIAHLGGPRSGHYRAAIRIVCPGSMCQWMILDDLGPPELTWKPPLWFCDNVVLVWLGHIDLTQAPTITDVLEPNPNQLRQQEMERLTKMIPTIR